jgi:hypothetical protein
MSRNATPLHDAHVLAKEAAAINRGDIERLIDLAQIGDGLAALIADEQTLDDAARLLVDLVADEPVARVIPLSQKATGLCSRVSDSLTTVSDGLTVLLDLLVATGATVAARELDVNDLEDKTVVLALAASFPTDELNGFELRTPFGDCARS